MKITTKSQFYDIKRMALNTNVTDTAVHFDLSQTTVRRVLASNTPYDYNSRAFHKGVDKGVEDWNKLEVLKEPRFGRKRFWKLIRREK